jgi:hypothetical protein
LETGSLTVELTPLQNQLPVASTQLPVPSDRLVILGNTLFALRRIWLRRSKAHAGCASAVCQQWARFPYLTSLCGVCLRQRGQNFLNSSRSVVVFRFFVVE